MAKPTTVKIKLKAQQAQGISMWPRKMPAPATYRENGRAEI